MNGTLDSWRSDIDGLRAIAVLCVVAFHARFESFSGGFIGVDVFFVISGYLMTKIFVKEFEEETFNILQFLERRIRRIFPTLVFVCLITLIISAFISSPSILYELSKSTATSLGMFSNLYYWSTKDYFSAHNDLFALIHTWSLSLEVQFYIFASIFFLISYLLRSIIFLIFCLILFGLISFFLAQLGGNLKITYPFVESSFNWFSQPAWASFYMLPGRFWEFAIGGGVFFLESKVKVKNRLICSILSFLGLILIGYSVFSFDQYTLFPSIWTFVPVLGSGLIIYSSKNTTYISPIISNKLFMWIGGVSYSMYLIHQPIFSFARQQKLDVSVVYTFSLLFILICILSHLSKIFLEDRYRSIKKSPRRVLLGSVSKQAVLSGVIICGIILLDGGKGFYPKADQNLLLHTKEYGEYVTRINESLRHVPFEDNNKTKVLIIGDSYSQDFTNVIKESNFFSDAQISTFYVSALCQLILVNEKQYNELTEVYKKCGQNSSWLLLKDAIPFIKNADIIVLASSWKVWAVNLLPATINNLDLSAEQKLVIVGRKNFGKVFPYDYVGMSEEDRLDAKVSSLEHHILTVKKMRDLLGHNFIDIHELVCGDSFSCPVFTPDAELISFDGSHLTKAGAMYIGKLIKEKGGIDYIKFPFDLKKVQ